jgi:hypothetical protein
MDFEISFPKEKGYLIIKTSGDTTPADVEASLKQAFNSPDWSTGTHILYDNRLENLDNLSSDDVQIISQKFTQFNDKLKHSKIALVMPEDSAFGLARMWESFTENKALFKTNVFRSIDDAFMWIEENG